MASSSIQAGILVVLQDLHPSSPFFKHGASLRVTGRLQEFSVESAIAVIVDGGASLRIDTQNLREIPFRIGSLYQFIGELLLPQGAPADQVFASSSHAESDKLFLVVLRARVGRNVDGMDMNLYHKSLQLRRQFEAKHMGLQSS